MLPDIPLDQAIRTVEAIAERQRRALTQIKVVTMIDRLPSELRPEASENARVIHDTIKCAHGRWMFSMGMADALIARLYCYLLLRGRK